MRPSVPELEFWTNYKWRYENYLKRQNRTMLLAHKFKINHICFRRQSIIYHKHKCNFLKEFMEI